jgi:NAD(P)H-hydrate epimerase
MALPDFLYSTAQVRALDAHAINEVGIPGYELMQRAGAAALRYLRIRWPMAHELVIVCGGGNNGGDGYVVARLARAAGLNASVLAVVPPEKLRGDAATAYTHFRDSAGPIRRYEPALLAGADVIVDALLGTGLAGTVREDMARVIRDINSAARPVLAIDVPSGLDSDSGMPLGDCVRAGCTVSFVGLKTGLFLGEGPQWAGTVSFDDLGVTAPRTAEFAPQLTRIVAEEIRQALPRHRRLRAGR